ncbi:MAG: hypothetical protein VKJ04_10450 [Vampirovibrionales bacterium]|nr:hypothetical protein [Vampirovibrionales bacterium]
MLLKYGSHVWLSVLACEIEVNPSIETIVMSVYSAPSIRLSQPSLAVRPASLHFSGQPKDDFRNANKFDALFERHYGGSIEKLIEAARQQRNYWDEGALATVYRIPNMPNFVLRVDKSFKTADLKKSVKRYDWEILPIEAGQPVVSFFNNAVQILRFQEGEKIPFTIADLIEKYGLAKLFDETQKVQLSLDEVAPKREAYNFALKLVNKMPQSAFDDMACKLKVLGHYPAFSFDPTITNILIDQDRNVFNLVDLTDGDVIRPYKNIAGMAAALTISLFASLDETAQDAFGCPDPENTALRPDLVALRHKILTKTFLAAYNTALALPPEDILENAGKYKGRRRFDFSIDYVCRISGFDWHKVKALLETEGLCEEAFLRGLRQAEVNN